MGSKRLLVLSVIARHPQGISDWKGASIIDMYPQEKYKSHRLRLKIDGLVEPAGWEPSNYGSQRRTYMVTTAGYQTLMDEGFYPREVLA